MWYISIYIYIYIYIYVSFYIFNVQLIYFLKCYCLVHRLYVLIIHVAKEGKAKHEQKKLNIVRRESCGLHV
jgi:hypothetical protein